MTGSERRQRRDLVQQFWFRFLDNELLSAQGDFQQMASQIVALLAALGLIVALALVGKHAFFFGKQAFEVRAVLAWADEAFLIRLTMAVVGIVTVLMWDLLFPDRRDCLVLGALPVRLRTIFWAKTAAIGLTLGTAAGAVNAFSVISFPFAVLPDGAGVLRAVWSVVAYLATMTAAGAFVFLALLAMQGVLVQALSHGAFQRLSSYAQLGAFGAILGGFFLPAPVAGEGGWFPPLWFLGVYQVLLGNRDWFFLDLARRALWALGGAGAVAVVTYGLGYGRHVRRIVEQAEAPPGGRSLGGGSGREGAVSWFLLRTLARSRQHRMLLAFCGGIGAAYVLESVAHLIRSGDVWSQPGRDLVAVPIYLTFFLLIGLRVAFSVPVEWQANWIFRLTGAGETSYYRAPVRRTLLTVGVLPVLIAFTPVYGILWGWRDAAQHLLFVLLLDVILVEVLTLRFHKIPFTCSYLPGGANLKVMFGVYWAVFTLLSSLVVTLDMWALADAWNFAKVVAAGAAVLAVLVSRRRKAPIVFEEQPPPVVNALELRPG